ncbi:MAG: M20 family metallopeptidase [Bacillota bacterium]|nr:M20 family metallopeptidase [Bacillota bacterium]
MRELIKQVSAAVGERRQNILAQLRECIHHNTVNPPGNEEALAQYVGDKMKALGARVEYQYVVPGRPNALCSFRFSGDRPCLLWNTHMDTVPAGNVPWKFDAWSGQEDGGLMYGRGACDAKGSLAGMMGALAVLRDLDLPLRGELLFTPVIWEEGGGKGTAHFVRTGMAGRSPDFAVVGEPTECNVSNAHRGSNRRLVVVHGVAAHSSDPDRGVNSIYRSSRLALGIEELHERLRAKRHPLLGSPVVSVNIISGGTKHNTIPDRTEMTVDRRRIPGEGPRQLDEEIEEIVACLRVSDPTFAYELVNLGMDKEPADTDPSDPLVQTALELCEALSKRPARLIGVEGGTDMTFLTNEAHVPTIIYGPGDMRIAHSVNENVPVDQVLEATAFYASLAALLLGPAGE